MNARALVVAAFSCCFLCACGGGGSSTASPPAAPSAAPSTSASPTPQPSPYPLTAGDRFVYAGQLVQADQSFPELVAPGSPSPEPIAVTTVNVTQNVSVGTNQTFNGASGLTDLHSAETDALASGLETTTATTDTYELIAASGTASTLLDYGSQYADEAGDGVSTLLTPAVVLDELPEVAGARWTNGPGSTIDEAIAGDTNGSAVTVVRTINADGSYSEKTTYPAGYSAPGYTGVGNIQENSDGSGSFSFVADGGAISITYSPPEPQPTGGPLITINEYHSLDTTGTPTSTFQFPSWYGSSAALYAETDLDQGIVAVPAACNLAKNFPTQATARMQSIARTDTILGYTETQTTTSDVAPGYGVLCSTLTDKETLYYDFSGDQAYVFTQAPPLEITTVAETLALQPSSTIAATSTVRGAQSARGVIGVPAGVSSALRARFDRSVRSAERTRLMQLIHHAARLRAQGGVQ